MISFEVGNMEPTSDLPEGQGRVYEPRPVTASDVIERVTYRGRFAPDTGSPPKEEGLGDTNITPDVVKRRVETALNETGLTTPKSAESATDPRLVALSEFRGDLVDNPHLTQEQQDRARTYVAEVLGVYPSADIGAQPGIDETEEEWYKWQKLSTNPMVRNKEVAAVEEWVKSQDNLTDEKRNRLVNEYRRRVGTDDVPGVRTQSSEPAQAGGGKSGGGIFGRFRRNK